MQVEEHGLGRLYAPDERDNLHLMATRLPVAVPKPAYKHWPGGVILNQGNTPQCVGYTCKQWKQITPVMNKRGLSASAIYARAQQIDEWPGEGYPGTSVRAGFKVLQEEGVVGEYVWSWSVAEVTDWILLKSPVIVGTDWYSNMSYPDNKGLVVPSGSIVGGHAYLLSGYNSRTKLIRIVNSWGYSWGQSGRAWIHEDDLQTLLQRQGEAVGAVELK